MSPTTTKLDKEIVKDLAKIAGVNYSEYGMNMFKAGSSLEGMSKTDVLYNDFKKFTTNSGKLGIGQIFTMDIDCINNELEDYKTIALFVTDIINNGSYVIFNTNSKDLVQSAFNLKDGKECSYIAGCVSRKKQMLPNLLNELEK